MNTRRDEAITCRPPVTPTAAESLAANVREHAEPIEQLRAFALEHGEIAFSHLCTAALAGEEWAIDRIGKALACGTSYPLLLADIIRATDTTREDEYVAKSFVDTGIG